MLVKAAIVTAMAAASPLAVLTQQGRARDTAISFAGTVQATRVAVALQAQLPVLRDRTRSVDQTPPGNSGYMDAVSFAKAQVTGSCADENPHMCDWETGYRDYRFRDDSLYDLAHPGPRDTATSPRPGVVVIRTPDGVPHVFGTASPGESAEQNVGFGAGVADAQDRLFQMELFRRAAEGRLSELLGPGYLASDIDWLQETETPAELTAQLQRMVPAALQADFRSYVDGVNHVIDQVNADPAQAPVEFLATQDFPVAHWTLQDSLEMVVLETKGFGEDGGNELQHAVLGQQLIARYGPSVGLKLFNDLNFRDDPGSPVTVPATPALAGRSSSAGNRYRFISYTNADTLKLLRALPPNLGSKLSTAPSRANAVLDTIFSLGLPHFGSNALVIDGAHSTTGHPILYGGPQVGYNVPDLFHEIELRGGSVAARGVDFAGLGPAVLIGHGPGYAYTTTSGQDDEVDTFVERIRRAPGDRTRKEYQFFRDGRWYPVWHASLTLHYRPTTPSFLPVGGDQPAPVEIPYTVEIYRTWHLVGRKRFYTPIFDWDTRDGIAFSKLRGFWDLEMGGVVAYGQYQTAKSVGQFRELAYHNTGALNQYYADDAGHIAYVHAGAVPIRVRGDDPRLPVPGDGSYDWRGFLSPRKWPQTVDPPQGWFANWNNRPAINWLDSGDGTRWGRFHHVAIIDDTVRALLRRHSRLSPADVQRVMRVAGTAEIRASTYFRPFLTGVSRWAMPHRIALRRDEREAIERVAAWNGAVFYPDGARLDPKHVAVFKDPAATIWYRWIDRFQDALYRPWFSPVIPSYTLDAFRIADDSPDQGADEFEDNFDPLMLSILQGRRATLPPLVDYLDYPSGRYPRSYAAYRDQVMAASRRALDAALGDLERQYGPDQSTWFDQNPALVTHFDPLGAGFVPDMPHENRGTFIQLVQIAGR
jgi:acyl-homoserine lactone acylase PvdQ